jgi:flagellar biosynthesis/type III secretory pathway M-ring protein FliF/YscJ
MALALSIAFALAVGILLGTFLRKSMRSFSMPEERERQFKEEEAIREKYNAERKKLEVVHEPKRLSHEEILSKLNRRRTDK